MFLVNLLASSFVNLLYIKTCELVALLNYMKRVMENAVKFLCIFTYLFTSDCNFSTLNKLSRLPYAIKWSMYYFTKLLLLLVGSQPKESKPRKFLTSSMCYEHFL
ncbi:hypothetical protein NC653_018248 [Populus alba x Populus x berolinensis]|uniref:Uncharacterized protein n=1 Tax=Populus alba x Populus x berolinensis TaxID=444605 RepID=A0AAD6QG22_9ROSI|nr:hypothetical protein NC653_018248 [Populus alba x Populus x berolinensis]